MLLLPRMLQSIEVLELPAQELESWIARAAEENEALRLEPPVEHDAAPGSAPERTRAGSTAFDRGERGRRGSREDSDRHEAFLQSQPARSKGLVERVEEELALLELDVATLEWVRLCVRSLDERGHLACDDAFLLAEAAALGLAGGAEALARAVRILQSLEPRGIGARNAVEAVLLQLDPDDPEYALLRDLLLEFLDEVARNKLPQVARAMRITVADVRRLLERLRGLSPRPGSELSGDDAPPLSPDLCVERTGSEFEVGVARSRIPAVAIEPEVAALAKDRDQPRDVRRYLRDKLERARAVVEAVEMRQRTLLRIGAATFRHQRAFLEHGPGNLVPLRMKDLADELGVHVSTVSRAVSGKYVQTPWGILALRHFFQASAGADEGAAREDVREVVRRLFESEDKTRPLSDDEVVLALRAQGLEMARRTVAKYRQELGIPSSYRRRLHH
jgi:RNA polymerase sigma-54 factor